MEPKRQADTPEEFEETYTSTQRVILRLLQWGAWTASFVAMLYFMRS